MRQFMDADFLLSTPTARRLYHEYAAPLPIIDYHCHLRPEQVAQDTRYRSITEVWLGGDHYKWRAMRAAGVPERLITGDAPDKEKFLAWAGVLPRLLGNPLYHWTHLELQRAFGIHETLDEKSAERIWTACNERLASPEFSARGLIRHFNVELICTTDDPADDLAHHRAVAADASFKTPVYPTFRPDKALNIQKPGFADYIALLSRAAGAKIDGFESLKTALADRMDFFAANGCRLSDHALDMTDFETPDEAAADRALKTALAGGSPTAREITVYRSTLLVFLGTQYAARGWAMQLHLAAMRDLNRRMFARLGPDTGYDAIDDRPVGLGLARLLDAMDAAGAAGNERAAGSSGLPKTVLYSLNPAHNELLVSIATCFNEAPAVSKVQCGSAWWFNDQLDGMRRQMVSLASLGLLSGFVGMLTDSRSYLSYTRHEYFRRLLCDILGGWAENGEVPGDMDLLGGIVRDVSYFNTKNFFFS